MKEKVRLGADLRSTVYARRQKKLLTLRLEQTQIENAKKIAAIKGLPYQTLLRVWIMEGINREFYPLLKKKKINK